MQSHKRQNDLFSFPSPEGSSNDFLETPYPGEQRCGDLCKGELIVLEGLTGAGVGEGAVGHSRKHPQHTRKSRQVLGGEGPGGR